MTTQNTAAQTATVVVLTASAKAILVARELRELTQMVLDRKVDGRYLGTQIVKCFVPALQGYADADAEVSNEYGETIATAQNLADAIRDNAEDACVLLAQSLVSGKPVEPVAATIVDKKSETTANGTVKVQYLLDNGAVVNLLGESKDGQTLNVSTVYGITFVVKK